MSFGKKLYVAGSLLEAQLVIDALKQAGVPVQLRNDRLSGMVGFLPEPSTQPTIWLEDADDWERARQVVTEYEARRDAIVDTELVCAACGEVSPGNFELCWKCRAPFVVG